MSKQLSPGAVVATLVVVVLLLGVFAWRTFSPPSARAGGRAVDIQAQMKQDMMQMQRRAPAAMPPGGR